LQEFTQLGRIIQIVAEIFESKYSRGRTEHASESILL
jgi:hypothetical protein